MRKTELVDRIAAEYPHLGTEGARQVIETILGNIETALGQGRRIELRGFGIFTPRRAGWFRTLSGVSPCGTCHVSSPLSRLIALIVP